MGNGLSGEALMKCRGSGVLWLGHWTGTQDLGSTSAATTNFLCDFEDVASLFILVLLFPFLPFICLVYLDCTLFWIVSYCVFEERPNTIEHNTIISLFIICIAGMPRSPKLRLRSHLPGCPVTGISEFKNSQLGFKDPYFALVGTE